MILVCLPTLILWLHLSVASAVKSAESTLACHKREYTFKATRTDSNGHQCWDYLNTMSCWGRCDSGEIADWRFPYKKAYHPVCMHSKKQQRKVKLKHCDKLAETQLAEYVYYEALTCGCQLCRSSSSSCESLTYQGNKGP
ncbi:thyrostimulin beta-5 subunit-like [Tachypleus tridentatus]|uniref:thyrostimulin beta-5 subunit-like n=1 Tax=Tachypleus tridentatus TaxID=6853 RepID=UPI003FD550E1